MNRNPELEWWTLLMLQGMEGSYVLVGAWGGNRCGVSGVFGGAGGCHTVWLRNLQHNWHWFWCGRSYLFVLVATLLQSEDFPPSSNVRCHSAPLDGFFLHTRHAVELPAAGVVPNTSSMPCRSIGSLPQAPRDQNLILRLSIVRFHHPIATREACRVYALENPPRGRPTVTISGCGWHREIAVARLV